MKKSFFNKLGKKGDICSYINEDGLERNNCKDMPITFCKNCKRFYVLDKDGNREEISLKLNNESLTFKIIERRYLKNGKPKI